MIYFGPPKQQNILKSVTEPIRMLRSIRWLGFTDALIAGGAVRDSFLDKPISDIDIFVQHPGFNLYKENFEWNNFWTNHIPNINFLDSFGTLEVDDPYKRDSIISVHDVNTYDFNYQIILLKVPPITFVQDEFDIGLCKCWHDGYHAHFSSDFMFDANNHRFTICPKKMTEAEYNNTIKHHIPSLKWKYPFSIDVDPRHQHLADKYGINP